MLLIKKSSINGKGLFTDSAVRAKTKLGEFTGERVSTREARRRAEGRKRIAIVEIDETDAIDGSAGGGPFQFINHSCEPNVFIRIAYGGVEFYAKMNIAA
jgi:SET domain-containing protein